MLIYKVTIQLFLSKAMSNKIASTNTQVNHEHLEYSKCVSITDYNHLLSKRTLIWTGVIFEGHILFELLVKVCFSNFWVKCKV